MILPLLLACHRHDDAPVDPGPPRDLVALVDPFIGTGGLGYNVGCAFPGAAWPMGLVKPSPDTADKGGSSPGFYHGGGYHADDELIQGFSHLHAHGIGVTAYGVVSLMPVDGMTADRTDEKGYRAWFSDEEAEAGYYGVTLTDSVTGAAIDVALTATEHTALHRYTFGDAASPTVLLDLEHVLEGGTALGGTVSVDPTTGTLTGTMDNEGGMGPAFRTWFEITFEIPPTSYGTWADGAPVAGSAAASGTDLGAWVSWDPASLPDHSVGVRVALSLVDASGAHGNLIAEHSGYDVDADVANAEAAWRSYLDPIQVWGGDDDEATIFATALYHTLLMPTTFSDVDGRYPGFDGAVHQSEGPRFHSDFSLWDTYRTAHPLYTFLWPDLQEELLWSLARMVEQGGNLPLWPLATYDASVMLGSPASIVVGESWQKGLLRDTDDATVLLDAALKTSLDPTFAPPYGARPDLSTYDALGYYPSDTVGRSVAWTQEVCTADAALLPMATDLGADAETLSRLADRQDYWKNLYDPAVGYFHARGSDGAFASDFEEDSWGDEYAEGNARQYLWLVIHDPEGLVETLGGEAEATARLDEFFGQSEKETEDFWPRAWYWHGNEPDLHAAWLYAYAGQPDQARQWVDWVAETFYSDGVDGLAGNDDAGTLSAWYVWASMGLYPLAGTDRYVLGAPRFDQIILPWQSGELTILRTGASVDRVTLDGAALSTPDLRHHQLGEGTTLRFEGE